MNEQQDINEKKKKGRDKGYLTLYYFSAVTAFIYAIILWVSYNKDSTIIGKSCFLYVTPLIIAWMWIIKAIIYYIKSDNTKYRYETEEEDSRKVRKRILITSFSFSLTCALSAFFFIFGILLIDFGAESFQHSTYERVKKIELATEYVCLRYENDIETLFPDSYEKLTEGVDFFETEWEDDFYIQKILERTEFESMEELTRRMHELQDYHLYIKVTGDRIEYKYTYTGEFGKTVCISDEHEMDEIYRYVNF